MVIEALGSPQTGASLIWSFARFSAVGSLVRSESSPRNKYLPSLLT